jgi:twinkle protein
MGKMILTGQDISANLDDLYSKGVKPGKFIGFESLRELYSVKKGTFTEIGGYPSHGKTEFVFEILMNLSEFYGWKHLIFSPETGTPEKIFSELEWKYVRVPFGYPGHSNRMTEAQHHGAKLWVGEHFTIADERVINTVDALLKAAKDYMINYHVDTITIDPWNDLKHTFDRQDIYLEEILVKIRKFCAEQGVHIFVCMHPRTIPPDGKKLPVPNFHQYSGGGAWASKGMSMICPYRTDDEGNEVEIIIQKAKPKEIGRKGTATLFYDRFKGRYYEKIDGTDHYAHREPLGAITREIAFPVDKFIQPKHIDDCPF